MNDYPFLASLSSVTPEVLELYLRGRGWHEVRKGPAASYGIWKNESGEKLILPLLQDADDYQGVLTYFINQLSAYEGVPAPNILNQISSVTADTLRISFVSEIVENGNIPFEDGLTMFKQTWQLFMAAACAANDPRGVYASRKSAEAAEFCKNLVMGQTEIGSYVITAHSKLPTITQTDLVRDGLQLYERRVTHTLTKALNAANSAIERSIAEDTMSPFEEAIPDGVSANLCEAIASMENGDEEALVRFNMKWSPLYPSLDPSLPTTIEFGPSKRATLKAAAEYLRTHEPVENFELRGMIIRLHHESSEPTGRTIISALTEGWERKNVIVDLEEEDYIKAIEAHKAGLDAQKHGEDPSRAGAIISCKGTLDKRGKQFFLLNYRDFKIEYAIT